MNIIGIVCMEMDINKNGYKQTVVVKLTLC